MSETADNPGIRVPPPTAFLIAILGGILLERRWPLPMPSRVALDVLGAAGVLAFLLLVFPSLINFHRKNTSALPYRPATALVTSGAYRFTRNPMYLGFAILTAACAPFFDTWWPIVLLPGALLTVQTFAIRREEGYLLRRFGAEYEAYTRRVRRWL